MLCHTTTLQGAERLAKIRMFDASAMNRRVRELRTTLHGAERLAKIRMFGTSAMNRRARELIVRIGEHLGELR